MKFLQTQTRCVQASNDEKKAWMISTFSAFHSGYISEEDNAWCGTCIMLLSGFVFHEGRLGMICGVFCIFLVQCASENRKCQNVLLKHYVLFSSDAHGNLFPIDCCRDEFISRIININLHFLWYDTSKMSTPIFFRPGGGQIIHCPLKDMA